ncbi:acidic mammalian chitinase-like isoform X2 [Euwallacea similis]|uniref:acidic mammalian chitinase-like isoform X2 n=1 Tax=Euwallacea similis TaxID=1736056 RepID=UPI00344DE658
MRKQQLLGLVMVLSMMGLVHGKYIGAYYWSGAVKTFEPENINATLLTHLYYAFLDVNDDASLTIQEEEQGFVPRLFSLKEKNPDLKLLFSVVNKNGSFSKVVASAELRQKFVKNAYDMVTQQKYDGLDFDWEFPKDADKENFVSLLKEISTEFKRNNYLVTAAVRAIPIYNNTGYIVPEIVKYLDIINVMTYDYYGAWSNTTGENSPLYPSSLDRPYEREYLNINASMNNWVKAGAPKTLLAMGIPFYGRTFTLTDPEQHDVHSPSSGGSTPLAPTYYQILENYQNYTTVFNKEQASNYKYSGTTWLAYDNEHSIKIKTKYAKDHALMGVFIWHVGGDDIDGKFSSRRQPLLQTINEVFTN